MLVEIDLETCESIQTIFDTVKERNLGSDHLYQIAKNENIIDCDAYTSTLTSIFMYFYEKGELENAIYSWLDGWDDHWSSSPDKLNVRILGTYVQRVYATDTFRNTLKNVFTTILPYFGETEIVSYYKNLLKDDFSID